jgi:IstB-like ATP binding protein
MNATATATKSAICSACGSDFEYEPVIAYRSREELPPPSRCGECETKREERYWLEVEAEREMECFARRVKGAQLPRRLLRVPYPANTPQAVREWGAGKIDGLCLTGNVGVGKTHLAAAACWHRLHREPIRWVRVAQLLTQLRAGFGDEDANAAKQVIAGTGGIVLDDLDKVNPTEFGREVLFCAIDGREQEGTPLLVTTNLSMNELGNRLGGAVASRISGYCKVLRVEGQDRRLK